MQTTSTANIFKMETNNETAYYTLLTSIVLLIGYLCAILSYAIDHFRVKYNEQFWSTKSNEEVIMKIGSIVNQFEFCEKDKMQILLKAKELNKYNMKFKIVCYKEGIKCRMNDLLGTNK